MGCFQGKVHLLWGRCQRLERGEDGLNGISLTYNYLNLPATAVRTTGTAVNLSYTYDASGNKLAKNSNGTVRNYIDGIEYKPDGTTIDIIHTEEGVAQNNGSGTYTYHYNLSDHLGNVRYTFEVVNGIISPLQKDDYYAFGKRKTSMLGSVDNKYLYNGKELQEELGAYDYGARFYDPVIGRWNVVDPLAENYQHWSPYTYATDDPISIIDPDGRSTQAVTTRYVDSNGNTILNTNDGRDDVYIVSDDKRKEFNEDVRLSTWHTDKEAWNDKWRGQLKQFLSNSQVNKAGINTYRSEATKAAIVKSLITGTVVDSYAAAKAAWLNRWSDPVFVTGNAIGGLHAFVNLPFPEPDPHFGYPEVTNNLNHATRYLVEAVLNIEKVKTAIANDLKPASSYKSGVRIQGVVTVDGVTIKYSGTKLQNGKINIGTMQPPRK